MALADDIRQLSEVAIFRHLGDDALRLLAFAAETRLLRRGDVLFREGETSDGAYFLIAGVIDLKAERDRKPLRLTAPALLGEIALLIDTVRPATATTAAASTVRLVTRALFHRVLEESPGSAEKVRAMLVGRISDYAADLARFANESE